MEWGCRIRFWKGFITRTLKRFLRLTTETKNEQDSPSIEQRDSARDDRRGVIDFWRMQNAGEETGTRLRCRCNDPSRWNSPEDRTSRVCTYSDWRTARPPQE